MQEAVAVPKIRIQRMRRSSAITIPTSRCTTAEYQQETPSCLIFSMVKEWLRIAGGVVPVQSWSLDCPSICTIESHELVVVGMPAVDTAVECDGRWHYLESGLWLKCLAT